MSNMSFLSILITDVFYKSEPENKSKEISDSNSFVTLTNSEFINKLGKFSREYQAEKSLSNISIAEATIIRVCSPLLVINNK